MARNIVFLSIETHVDVIVVMALPNDYAIFPSASHFRKGDTLSDLNRHSVVLLHVFIRHGSSLLLCLLDGGIHQIPNIFGEGWAPCSMTEFNANYKRALGQIKNPTLTMKYLRSEQ